MLSLRTRRIQTFRSEEGSMKYWLEEYLFAVKTGFCAAAAGLTVLGVLAGIVCGAIALMDALGVL